MVPPLARGWLALCLRCLSVRALCYLVWPPTLEACNACVLCVVAGATVFVLLVTHPVALSTQLHLMLFCSCLPQCPPSFVHCIHSFFFCLYGGSHQGNPLCVHSFSNEGRGCEGFSLSLIICHFLGLHPIAGGLGCLLICPEKIVLRPLCPELLGHPLDGVLLTDRWIMLRSWALDDATASLPMDLVLRPVRLIVPALLLSLALLAWLQPGKSCHLV